MKNMLKKLAALTVATLLLIGCGVASLAEEIEASPAVEVTAAPETIAPVTPQAEPTAVTVETDAPAVQTPPPKAEEKPAQTEAPKEETTVAPEKAEPSAEPSAAPEAEPSEEPSATPEADPTAEPSATPEAEPSEEPSATPEADPTAEPSAAPEAEPTTEPTPEPTAVPEATEIPAPFAGTVEMRVIGAENGFSIGDTVTMEAILTGFENVAYTLCWECSEDGEIWSSAPGANAGMSYAFTLSEDNAGMLWRVSATVAE